MVKLGTAEIRLIGLQAISSESGPKANSTGDSLDDRSSTREVSEPLPDQCEVEKSHELVSGETSPKSAHTPSYLSTVQDSQDPRTSESPCSNRHSNDTSPTELSLLEHDVSRFRTRRYSTSQVPQSSSSGISDHEPVVKPSGCRPISATLVAKLRQELLITDARSNMCIRADDSMPAKSSPIKIWHSLADAQLAGRRAQKQLGGQQWLLDSTLVVHELELHRMRETLAQELAAFHNECKDELAQVNDQLTTTISRKEDLSERLDNVEKQLSITQGELEVKSSELKSLKSEAQRLRKVNRNVGSPKELQPELSRSKDFGMGKASPASKHVKTEASSSAESEKVTKLQSQLRDLAAETAREKTRGDGLVKERDEARSKQDSMSEEISTLKIGWESEYRKCKMLQYHMQDEPGKTEPLENQLQLKDEAYKALEKRYGECLAENAELRSRIGHVEETANAKVTSLERKLVKEHEMMLDMARSRDNYLRSNIGILALHKGTITDQEWAARVNEQCDTALEETRVLGLHLKASIDRETHLTKQVLVEKSAVAMAQQKTRERDDKISELNYEKTQADRELENATLRIEEHNTLVAAKESEVRTIKQKADQEISNMAAKLWAVMDKGTMLILQEREQDLCQLENVLSQYSQMNERLQQHISVLETTHFWDTDAARKADEAHQADTSRMIAAEDQITRLINQLSGGDSPTNERLWNQWRQCDSARVEARQALEQATGHMEDLRELGMDLCSYINTLGETFSLTWIPGSELAAHHERILGRVSKILRPTEAENELPVVVYPHSSSSSDGVPGMTALGEKVDSAALPDVQLSIRDTAEVMPEILDNRVRRMSAERKINVITKNELESGSEAKGSGYQALVSEDQLTGRDEQHPQTGVTTTRAEKTSCTYRARGGPLSPYDINQAAIESPRPDSTPSLTMNFPTMVAAKVRLRLDLERLAKTAHIDSDTTHKVEPIHYPSQGLDGARDTIRKNLELLAQTARIGRGTASNAEDRPHPPPGLDTTPDMLRQNLECLAQITPCHDEKDTKHSVFSQNSSRTDNFGYIQKLNPEKSLQAVRNESPEDTTHSADTDLRSKRNCFCCKAKPSKAPSLRPGQFWDDYESWIRDFDNRIANAPTTPELNNLYTCTPLERPVDWQDDGSDVSPFNLNKPENEDQPLNEEAQQVYLGSDRDGGDQAAGDGKLVRPSIVVNQVLGPGEEWDDEDGVEIVC